MRGYIRDGEGYGLSTFALVRSGDTDDEEDDSK